MVQIEYYDHLYIRINTTNREYLNTLHEHFSDFAPGYLFSPKYKMGRWNGKIYLFDYSNKLLPYGLLTEFIQFHKKYFKDVELTIDDQVKSIFAKDNTFDNLDLINCKLWDYREYQEDSIRKAMAYKKCVLRIVTAGGKSLVIWGIIENLRKENKINKSLIIVPSVSLVKQFYKDMIDYGSYKEHIGMVYSKQKDWDKSVVISTWQTLKNNYDKINDFDCVIVDECHSSRALQLTQLLKHSEATYKIGCTGTMPETKLDQWNVKSFLGPIVKEVSANDLANLDFIADCKIMMYHLHYKEQFSKTFNEARDEIFTNDFRMQFISNLLTSINDTCLLLVGKVETEGEILKEEILKSHIYDEENIVFISGSMDADKREEWRQKVIQNPDKKYCLIATYAVFQQGINLPRLSYLIFAAPFASKIRILQSVGRVLRKHISKTDGAIVYDIVDEGNKWFPKQGDARLRFYDKEKFEVIEKDINN